jgi:hypothetical protein
MVGFDVMIFFTGRMDMICPFLRSLMIFSAKMGRSEGPARRHIADTIGWPSCSHLALQPFSLAAMAERSGEAKPTLLSSL